MGKDTTITVSRTAKQGFSIAKEQLPAKTATETVELLVDIAHQEGYLSDDIDGDGDGDGYRGTTFAKQSDVTELEEQLALLRDSLDTHKTVILDIRDRLETLEYDTQ